MTCASGPSRRMRKWAVARPLNPAPMISVDVDTTSLSHRATPASYGSRSQRTAR